MCPPPFNSTLSELNDWRSSRGRTTLTTREERGKHSWIFHNAKLEKCGQPVGGCGIWLVILRPRNWITNPVAVLDIILYKKVFRFEIGVDKDSWTPYWPDTNVISEISVRTDINIYQVTASASACLCTSNRAEWREWQSATLQNCILEVCGSNRDPDAERPHSDFSRLT
jgi:hypothetical protein